MKIHIELDLTPEEARSVLGLPDLSDVQEGFVSQLRSKVEQATGTLDVEQLLRMWTRFGQPLASELAHKHDHSSARPSMSKEGFVPPAEDVTQPELEPTARSGTGSGPSTSREQVKELGTKIASEIFSAIAAGAMAGLKGDSAPAKSDGATPPMASDPDEGPQA